MGNRGRKSVQQPGPYANLKFPGTTISLDFEAFDTLLHSQGVRVKHLKAIPDPRGILSFGEFRSNDVYPNTDQFIYKEAGCFLAVMATNDRYAEHEVEGEVDISSCLMTPPRFYEGSQTPILISVYDRFEMEDIELRVESSQLLEASYTGVDRLNWPAVCVEYCIGNDGFEYKENVHFRLNNNGEIVWLTQQRPKANPETGKGEVYAVRYRYVPFWVVRRILNEIRVARRTDPMTGESYAERLPYRLHLAREFIYRDKTRPAVTNENDQRFQDSPSIGNEWSPGESNAEGTGQEE